MNETSLGASNITMSPWIGNSTLSPSLFPTKSAAAPTTNLNQTLFNETISVQVDKALDLLLFSAAPTSTTNNSFTQTFAPSPLSTTNSSSTTSTNEAVITLLDQGYVFSASPYEPNGWKEIFAVVLLSLSIFALPLLAALVSVLMKPDPIANSPLPPPSPSNNVLRFRQMYMYFQRAILYMRVFKRFCFPRQHMFADCDKLGCEAASLLLLERELGRFLCIMACFVNIVLLPVYLSFPAQPQASDFTPYTFQNVPPQSLNIVIWIHIVLAYLISLLTFKFSHYMLAQIEQIEFRFSENDNPRNTQYFYFLSGKHDNMLTEQELLLRCNEQWFRNKSCSIVATKLFHQSKLQDHVYFFRSLVTCENPILQCPIGLQLECAPNPKDILWDAFSHSTWTFYARSLGVNCVLLATLFLFTTPVTFISFLSSNAVVYTDEMESTYLRLVAYIRAFSLWLGDFLFDFLPQILLVVCDAYLLMFLSLSSKQFELFFTSSEREVSVLKKSYWFLLFNTLILPSLALSSVGSFVGRLFQNETSAFALLGKAFVTSSGAFTLTFIATQTWVGASLDIARISERAYLFIARRCGARNNQHQLGIELDFGGEYAISLVMFALCVTFSTVVPLILMFGVVYFFVKQATDDYLLRYVFVETEKLPRAYVGRSAVRYLAIAVILLQSSLFGFFSSETCFQRQTSELELGSIPCVNKDYSGVLIVRGTFAQLLAMLVCLVMTCVLALREWIMASKHDQVNSWSSNRVSNRKMNLSAAATIRAEKCDEEDQKNLK